MQCDSACIAPLLAATGGEYKGSYTVRDVYNLQKELPPVTAPAPVSIGAAISTDGFVLLRLDPKR